MIEQYIPQPGELVRFTSVLGDQIPPDVIPDEYITCCDVNVQRAAHEWSCRKRMPFTATVLATIPCEEPKTTTLVLDIDGEIVSTRFWTEPTYLEFKIEPVT